MRLDLAFSPLELVAFGDLGRYTVVVIDVLRATTTIAHALANGAQAIVPVESIERARALADELPERPLLAGERHGLKIPGFDLGNSPREMTPTAVQGRLLVLATTNGTTTLHRVKPAKRVLTASFANLASVARTLIDDARDVLIACAAREGEASLEDTICAGYLIERVENGLDRELQLGDAAIVAHAASVPFERVLDMLWRSHHGRFLVQQGLEADLSACAALDTLAVVPELVGERLVRQDDLVGATAPERAEEELPGE